MGSGSRSLGGIGQLRCLDGEGVFEFFRPGLKIFDFSFLLFQEEVFDPVQASVDLGNILTYILSLISSLLAIVSWMS